MMPGRKPDSAGPMNMQPVQPGSAAPMLPRMPGIGATRPKKPLPKKQLTGTEEAQLAKAKTIRRNSLRKQRLAQKDNPAGR